MSGNHTPERNSKTKKMMLTIGPADSDFQKLHRLSADPGRRVKGGGGMPAKTLMVHIARCHHCGRPLKRAVLRRKDKADAVKYRCGFQLMHVLFAHGGPRGPALPVEVMERLLPVVDDDVLLMPCGGNVLERCAGGRFYPGFRS